MRSVLDEDEEQRRKQLLKITWINQIGPLSIAAGTAIAAAIYWWFAYKR